MRDAKRLPLTSHSLAHHSLTLRRRDRATDPHVGRGPDEACADLAGCLPARGSPCSPAPWGGPALPSSYWRLPPALLSRGLLVRAAPERQAASVPGRPGFARFGTAPGSLLLDRGHQRLAGLLLRGFRR